VYGVHALNVNRYCHHPSGQREFLYFFNILVGPVFS
jgi:hypothetical protein